MQRTFTILILGTLMACASAPATPIVLPIPTQLVKWDTTNVNSHRLLRNGEVVKTLTHDSVIVVATLDRTEGYLRAQVGVQNRSQRSVEVRPDQFWMESIGGKQDTLPYRDPDIVAQHIESNAYWGAIAGNVIANAIAAQDVGEITRKEQTGTTANGQPIYTTKTETYGDTSVYQRNAKVAEGQQQQGASKGAGIRSQALRENTVLPGEHVEGIVFFRGSKSHALMLNVFIEGTLYQLPFQFK